MHRLNTQYTSVIAFVLHSICLVWSNKNYRIAGLFLEVYVIMNIPSVGFPALGLETETTEQRVSSRKCALLTTYQVWVSQLWDFKQKLQSSASIRGSVHY